MSYSQFESQFRILGRVIPERTNATRLVPDTEFEFDIYNGFYNFVMIKSSFTLDIKVKQKIDYETVITISKLIVTSLVVEISFRICAYYHTCFDSILNINNREYFDIPVSNKIHIDDDDRFLFKRTRDGTHIEIPKTDYRIIHLQSLATLALNEAYYTPVICRMIKEFIAKQLSVNNKINWIHVQKTLYISEKSLRSSTKIAADIRHGEIRETTWEDRKTILELTWEIIYRYSLHLDGTLEKMNPKII